MSLIQIDGSEPADVKAEAESGLAPVKADHSLEQNNRDEYNGDDGYTGDGEYSGDGSQKPQKIIVDPKKLFSKSSGSGEKQDYQKRNYAARFVIICGIVLCLLFAVITLRSFKKDIKVTGSYSNYNTMLVTPVYTEIEFNADDIDLDLPAIISHKCIEYTDSYNRILFFTANLTEENKGLQIKVEMLDRHGRTLDTHSNSSFGVAAGDEFMIPVSFTLSPDWNLDGVTYKISAETFKEEKKGMLRKIADVTEADKGYFFITYESSAYYNMDTYVVLYKNGKVVDVLRGYGDVDDTGKTVVELYKEDVDYDNFKVYY